MAVLSTAYSSACRTFTFASAPLLLGLSRLNTRYGLLLALGKILRFGLFDALRAGRAAVGTGRSQLRSAVPACSCCCTAWSEPCPWVMSMVTTCWCRNGSDAWGQAGFRFRTMLRAGWWLVMAYGPSDSVCCRNVAPSGTYSRYSTGAADANGRARMLRKSLAGWVRLITTVDRSGVVTPEIWGPFM